MLAGDRPPASLMSLATRPSTSLIRRSHLATTRESCEASTAEPTAYLDLLAVCTRLAGGKAAAGGGGGERKFGAQGGRCSRRTPAGHPLSAPPAPAELDGHRFRSARSTSSGERTGGGSANSRA